MMIFAYVRMYFSMLESFPWLFVVVVVNGSKVRIFHLFHHRHVIVHDMKMLISAGRKKPAFMLFPQKRETSCELCENCASA